MTLEVVPSGEEHLEDVAVLASSRYKGFHGRVSLLPSRYAEVSTPSPLLHNIVGAGPGVTAIRRGRLVGLSKKWAK
jgi:hypothetical protein